LLSEFFTTNIRKQLYVSQNYNIKIPVSEIAKVIGEDDKQEESSLIVKEESSNDTNIENTASAAGDNATNTNNAVEGTALPAEQSAEDDAVRASLHLTCVIW